MKAKDAPPSIAVVDDDPAVRDSVQRLFKSVGLPAVTYSSAQGFLGDYRQWRFGCMVLDVRMPGLSGLELQKQLATRGDLTPVIFITGHGDIAMAVEAMRNGAFDFLRKPFRDQDLLDRVQRALAMDRVYRSRATEKREIDDRWASLTPREREVLKLVTQGQPNKVMAAVLGVSQRTVEIHRARVMEKMGVASLAQLVRIATTFERPDAEVHGGAPLS